MQACPIRARSGPNAIVVPGVGVAPAVNNDSIARLQGYAFLLSDVLKLPAVHRPVHGHVGLAAMLWHIQKYAPGQNAIAPLVHGAVLCAGECKRLFRLAPVPHAVLVPDMAKGVNVRRGGAVVHDAVIVHRRARVVRPLPHREELLGRPWVLGAGLNRKWPAQGHSPPLADQLGGLQPLFVVDHVDGACRALVSPAPPVATLGQVAPDLLHRRHSSFGRRHNNAPHNNQVCRYFATDGRHYTRLHRERNLFLTLRQGVATLAAEGSGSTNPSHLSPSGLPQIPQRRFGCPLILG